MYGQNGSVIQCIDGRASRKKPDHLMQESAIFFSWKGEKKRNKTAENTKLDALIKVYKKSCQPVLVMTLFVDGATYVLYGI